MHVHVASSDGEQNSGWSPLLSWLGAMARDADLRAAQELVQEHANEIRNAWNKHFGD